MAEPQKGDKGGISRAARLVLIGLLVLILIGWTTSLWATRASIDNQNMIQAREQAQQRKQGQVIEHKICTDLRTMASIQPPSGNAAANPSRGYEQAEHQAWTGLLVALGCK